jgi:hypothetical protein
MSLQLFENINSRNTTQLSFGYRPPGEWSNILCRMTELLCRRWFCCRHWLHQRNLFENGHTGTLD